MREEEKLDGRAAVRDCWKGLLEPQGIGRWDRINGRGQEGLVGGAVRYLQEIGGNRIIKLQQLGRQTTFEP